MLNSEFGGANWIASDVVGGPRSSCNVPYFRKSFNLDRIPKSATLRITALGVYECEINGQLVSDDVFEPGWTDYHQRVYFKEYDVTAQLGTGENVLGVILGDGWYCGFIALRDRQIYGDRPRLLASLNLSFADGPDISLVSDGTWQTSVGPLLESDMLMGESYDARLELGSWSSPNYDAARWRDVIEPPLVDQPAILLRKGPSVRRIEKVAPRSVSRLPRSHATRIIDFGQNLSGRVRITVRAERGVTVRIRHAEMLNPDGTLYTENLRGARATDYYTCQGSEEETWEPRFTFHGFRFAEISGLRESHSLDAVAVVLHSDTPVIGRFECSNPAINQLQSNIVWSQKGNFLDVPTDCPQRDERMGWVGDAQVFIRTACFNMDVRDFFAKWLFDLRDAQRENGAIPCVVPSICNADFINLEDAGPAWSDAAIICPWTIYLCYGDVRVLAESFDSMQRYMDFTTSKRCLGDIRSHPDVDPWGGFGDWLAKDGSGKYDGATPRDLIGTAFYAYDAEIMFKSATILQKTVEAEKYRKLHIDIVNAFRRRFVTEEGLLVSGTQTSYILALKFGLIPDEVRPVAARELVRNIERLNYHLSTGFVGTPYLLDVLGDNGYLDIAYRLLEQTTYPSWLFPITNGATTIWEHWDGWTPDKGMQNSGMNSFNHYAYGAVGAWLYRAVAGLDLDETCPGYRHVIVRPRPGGTLSSASASLDIDDSKITIAWSLVDAELKVSISIPKDIKATFVPPEDFIYLGKTSFEGPWAEDIVLNREINTDQQSEAISGL